MLWCEGVAALAINLAANFAGLSPETGLRLLAGALTVGQLLTWAFIALLTCDLWTYALGQWRRWRPA